MNEEELKQNIEETNAQKELEKNYSELINDYKKNSVPKTEYEKVIAENKKLLSSVLNGDVSQSKAAAEDKPKIHDLRDKLFHSDELSNLELWDTALKLRKALMDSGESDPFLPQGQKISATFDDAQAADRVAKAVQDCIDFAEGDSQLFTNELYRKMSDVRG